MGRQQASAGETLPAILPGAQGRRIAGTAPLIEGGGVDVEAACPSVVAQVLEIRGARPEAGWRVTLDRAVDNLLRQACDDGLWRDAHSDDALSTTWLVVRGLATYHPAMPATRTRYVRQVVQRTLLTVRALRQADGSWGSAEHAVYAQSILTAGGRLLAE